jgi:hypothetical protein
MMPWNRGQANEMLKGKNGIETFTNSSQLVYKDAGMAGIFFVTILSFKTLSHESI